MTLYAVIPPIDYASKLLPQIPTPIRVYWSKTPHYKIVKVTVYLLQPKILSPAGLWPSNE